MYQQYFGLHSDPFALTPDTEFFFRDWVREEALNTLIYGVRSGEGFIKMVGEVGTGKTTLCRQILRQIEPEAKTAYLPNPQLQDTNLIATLARELGVDTVERTTNELFDAIQEVLLATWREGRPVVLVLDEAQALPNSTLEQARLLSNLETEKAKLLRIVLFGQPELDQRLKDPAIRQLQQRIVYSYYLRPFAKADLVGYLDHRLRVAGYGGPPLFEPKAVRALHKGSGGVPRLVNILAHKSLLAAFGDGAVRVKGRHVRAAVRDTEAAHQRRWRPAI